MENNIVISSTNTASSQAHRIIANYLDANFTNPMLDMTKLSSEVCLSVSYISSILKKRGTSFVKYIMAQRMELAKKRLKNSDTPIGEIAHEVGFIDSYYFSRCFKKHIGVSPKQYRRMRQSVQVSQ